MPRVLKDATYWANKFTDFKSGINEDAEPYVTCKFCCTKISIIPGKKPSTRIKEHLASPRHNTLKDKHTKSKTKQLTLADTQERNKEKENEREGAIYDFVRSLLYSGKSLFTADGPIGENYRKWVPAARTMPYGKGLRKYQTAIYNEEINAIIRDMKDEPVCLITDESPDFLGEPYLNTLVSYYSKSEECTKLYLIDVQKLSDAASSYTVGTALNRCIFKINKKWHDVIALCSDSASYMVKLVDDLNKTHGTDIVHIRDLAHCM
jgi:hypothetical protein